MNTQKMFLILLILFLIMGCGAKKFKKIDTGDSNDVYVAGFYDIPPMPNDFLFCWKNGEYVHLQSGDTWFPSFVSVGYAFSIFKDDKDIYVAGFRELDGQNYASYWKNGKLIASYVDGAASSIYVSGKDIYMAGGWRERLLGGSLGDVYASYWKNGQLIKLGKGLAYDIVVDGQDVYVAGALNQGGFWERIMDELFFWGSDLYEGDPLYWKNGEAIELGKAGSAISIFLKGEDIYVAGSYKQEGTKYACYWKNGELVDLGEGSAAAIVVADDDVYVAGQADGNACYWKNGEIVDIDKSGAAFDILVVKNTDNQN